MYKAQAQETDRAHVKIDFFLLLPNCCCALLRRPLAAARSPQLPRRRTAPPFPSLPSPVGCSVCVHEGTTGCISGLLPAPTTILTARARRRLRIAARRLRERRPSCPARDTPPPFSLLMPPPQPAKLSLPLKPGSAALCVAAVSARKTQPFFLQPRAVAIGVGILILGDGASC